VGKLKVAASYGGDVQERKIRKSGAAEARVYATSTHGHGQTIGDL
jgi:hypothetical protein